MDERQRVVTLVGQLKNASLDDVCRADDESFSMVRYLIHVLNRQKTTLNTEPGNDSVRFNSSSGATILAVKKNSVGGWDVSGEIASRLNNLLAAVRIHEVESYEWVYMPPDIRQNLMSVRAEEVGVPVEELKHLMNLWVA